MASFFDAEYQSAARWAAGKISAVLPESLREQVRELRHSIHFIPVSADRVRDVELLPLIRRAILKQQTVRFVYHTRHTAGSRSSSQTREADPYGLVFVGGAWTLVGYCHLRHDMRIFRLSRMEQLAILPRTFTRPIDYMDRERQRRDSGPFITAILNFDSEVARWLEEDPFYFIVERQRIGDLLQVTLRLRDEQDAVQWILSWGRHVQVLQPASLRARIIEELEGALRTARKSESLLT